MSLVDVPGIKCADVPTGTPRKHRGKELVLRPNFLPRKFPLYCRASRHLSISPRRPFHYSSAPFRYHQMFVAWLSTKEHVFFIEDEIVRFVPQLDEYFHSHHSFDLKSEK